MSKYLEECTVKEIQEGIIKDDAKEQYVCLVCGARYNEGEIYPVEDRFFEAGRAAKWHAETAHGGHLETLMASEPKYVGLTENQKNLMRMLYEGISDAEIAKATGVTAATVRRQRFLFREKAKQAKLYLAIYGCIEDKKKSAKETFLPIHEGARMLDERYMITQEENEKILHIAFESLEPLRLKQLPVKEKKKLAVLARIAESFEKGRDYTEKEINGILLDIFPDYVTLRRYLIEYGFLDREVNGSRYWVR